MNKSIGQVSISFEYLRHVGPRYIHGAVRLRFDALRPYSFRSDAKWPDENNYEAAIQKSVEAVLKEKLGSLEQVEVVLESICFDAIYSCEEGFRKAARIATEAAFLV